MRHGDLLIDKLEADGKYAEQVNKRMAEEKPRKIAAERFLALVLDRDFSERDHREVQKIMLEHGVKIVPTRDEVREEKKQCLEGIDPNYGNWEVTVPFPKLRKKTLDRFFEIKECVDKLKEVRDDYYDGELELIDTWKWGFDGIGSMPLSDQQSEKVVKPQDENVEPMEAGDAATETRPEHEEVEASGNENVEPMETEGATVEMGAENENADASGDEESHHFLIPERF